MDDSDTIAVATLASISVVLLIIMGIIILKTKKATKKYTTEIALLRERLAVNPYDNQRSFQGHVSDIFKTDDWISSQRLLDDQSVILEKVHRMVKGIPTVQSNEKIEKLERDCEKIIYILEQLVLSTDNGLQASLQAVENIKSTTLAANDQRSEIRESLDNISQNQITTLDIVELLVQGMNKPLYEGEHLNLSKPTVLDSLKELTKDNNEERNSILI